MKLNFYLGVTMAASLNCGAYANDMNDWSSGGGKSIACYDSNGSLRTVELLDHYEARILFGQQNIQNDENNFKKILDNALTKLEPTGYSLVGIDTAKSRLEEVFKHLVFIPPNERLEDIDDDFSQVEIPSNCKKEQLAVYDKDKVRIDLRLWSLLKPIDQAGLLLHETVYWLERNIKKVRDSRRARRVVALTLDSSVSFELVRTQGNGELLCNSHDPRSSYVFTIEKDSNSGEQFINFALIDGEMVLSKKTLKIPVGVNFPFDMVDREERTAAFSGKTESKIEGEDTLIFSAKDNQLTITGIKSTYPVRTYPPRRFFCWKSR